MTTVDATDASVRLGSARLGHVRIAWADADDPAVAGIPRRDALTRLGAGQVRRHETMKDARADRFLVGRWLLADLIAEVGGTHEFVLSSVCDRCGAADHGAPRVVGADVAVSVSYARGMVAVAAVAGSDASALGIDIETDTGPGPLIDLGPLFTPADPPDLRGWTLIEAALKADGRGLRVSPDTVRLGDDGTMLPAARRVLVADRDVGIEAAPAPAPEGYVLSVAVRAEARC